MDISKYEIRIKDHAFERAIQRGIDPSNIEKILKSAKVKRFGKQGIKFINEGSKRTIICIGQIVNIRIIIITVEIK